MKVLKIKRPNNSSFVTNRDLLDCLRTNKSFLGSRENSTRLHSNQSKVSLLQKKDYGRLLTQENQSNMANTTPDFIPGPADRAIVLLQDCITALGDGNQALTHKLRKAVGYVREMQAADVRRQEGMKQAEREGEKALLKKLQVSCQEKAVLKMQNVELKEKLKQYRDRIAALKKQKQNKPSSNNPIGSTISNAKNNPNTNAPSSLQELLVYQGQLMDRQCEQNRREGQELRRMLKVQALKIQEMLGKDTKMRPLNSPCLLRY